MHQYVKKKLRTDPHLWRRRKTRPHCSSSKLKAEQLFIRYCQLLAHVSDGGAPTEFFWREGWQWWSLGEVTRATVTWEEGFPKSVRCQVFGWRYGWTGCDKKISFSVHKWHVEVTWEFYLFFWLCWPRQISNL